MSNIIKAVFGAGRKTQTKPVYQYNYGMVFKPVGINLPDVYEVHFSNYEYTNKAKPQLGDANGCVIPDEYFQTGQDIWAFIYLHTGENDGETEYKTHIPIVARPQVDPSEPTPVQRDIIEQAISTLNTAVQKTAQDVVDADGYAQAAEQAKTDAVSAQEAAESAQSAAESAQEAAEAAQRTARESSQSAKRSADEAKSEADRAVSAVEHNPIIRNNYWWVWDSENDVYVNSGVVAIGQNGVSPYVDVVPIENGYQVVITDVNGTHSFILRNGNKGDAGRGIESTSYDPDTDVLTLIFTDGTSFSTPSLRGATGNGIQSIEKTGTSGLVDTYTVTYTNGQTFTYTVTNGAKGDSGETIDVQINGQSIVEGGMANIPIASYSQYGLVKPSAGLGTGIASNGGLAVVKASEASVKLGKNDSQPVVPQYQHQATFYGLTKAAGVDMANSSNAVGTYTDEAKVAIQKMLGLNQQGELIADVTASEDLAEIDIRTDMNGQPFQLKKMIVLFKGEPSTTGNRDAFYTTLYYANESNTYATTSTPSWTYPAVTSKMQVKTTVTANLGMPIDTMCVVATGEGNTQNVTSMAKEAIAKYLTGFRIYQSASDKSLIPSGSNIKIYGIRA